MVLRTHSNFREVHPLPSGLVVTVRHVRPADAAELQRAFRTLSPESRYRRFFGNGAELSDAALEYLTCVDGQNHVAIVATTDSPDLKTEVGLGVARFVRLAGTPHVAEASVVVIDGMQRLGVGRVLLETLVVAARERGINHFRAEVLASNEPMRKILEDVKATMVRHTGDVIVFDISLAEQPEEASALAKLLQFAASSVGDMLRGWRPPDRIVSSKHEEA